MHPFDAQAPGELSLAVDDYVIVRQVHFPPPFSTIHTKQRKQNDLTIFLCLMKQIQVAGTGWSEGEYKGKAGWFPSAYVEKQEKAPASKIVESNPKQQ